MTAWFGFTALGFWVLDVGWCRVQEDRLLTLVTSQAVLQRMCGSNVLWLRSSPADAAGFKVLRSSSPY